jgi:Ca2+-binding EF-hand superfamily protein
MGAGASGNKANDGVLRNETEEDFGELRLNVVRNFTRTIFNTLDKDNSGSIDKTEFKLIFAKMGIPFRDLDNVVNRELALVDADGDGNLTYEEYFNAIVKNVCDFEGENFDEETLRTHFRTISDEKYDALIENIAKKFADAAV